MKEFLKKWFASPALLTGIVVACAAGFGFNIVTFTGSADAKAAAQVRTAQIELLTPICVANADKDPLRDARLAELQEASSFNRQKIVTDFGWAPTPGPSALDTAIARLCVTEALKLAQPAA